jgi:hypothetical protein
MTDFYVQRTRGKEYVRGICKKCNTVTCREYFRSSKGKDSRLRSYRKMKQQTPERVMFYNAKANAKKRGLPFDLRPEDIVIPSHCPVLGIPLFWTDNQKTPNTPSTDRIDSSRGYSKDNIVVVSWRANKLKQDASVAELRALWEFYATVGS